MTKSGVVLELGGRVRRGLSGLRFRARAALTTHGASSFVLYAVVLSLVSFGLDRTLRLAWETRGVALFLAVVLLLGVVLRRLVRPLGTELSDAELARRVEAVNPELRWRLLSAVQFADPSWQPGPETSLELAACVVRDAEDLAGSVEFGAAVPLAPVSRAAFRGGVVFAAALLLVYTFPAGATTWFQRNVLLMDDVSWPRDTQFELRAITAEGVVVVPTSDGVYTVPRGGDVVVEVLARGVVPKRVYIDTEPLEDGHSGEVLAFDALEGGVFRTTLERVSFGFRFTVEGGDGFVGPFTVEVLHRPWIEALRIEVVPPEYTGLAARTFPLESSSVALPVGTSLTLRVETSKPLRRAFLVEYRIGTPVADQTAAIHTGTVVTDPPGFFATVDVERTGILDVEIFDTDTLSLERPTRFTLVAVPDQAPTVRLELFGIGLNVTPQATVRFAVAAEDDYGVVGRRLKFIARLGGEEKPLEGERILADGPSLTASKGVLELKDLKLEIKMSLTLWGEAVDGDPREANTGASPALQLRVVTPEALLNQLLRRLHEQRLELERMISQEEQLAQGLLGQDLKTLARAAGAQRDVSRTVLRAADAVERVVAEMASNKLLDKGTRGRLREQVIEPLRALDIGPLTEAADLAEAALGATGPNQILAMGLAGEAAKAIATELRRIVDRMGRIEELAELVSLLKKVIREQRELLDKTKGGGD